MQKNRGKKRPSTAVTEEDGKGDGGKSEVGAKKAKPASGEDSSDSKSNINSKDTKEKPNGEDDE